MGEWLWMAEGADDRSDEILCNQIDLPCVRGRHNHHYHHYHHYHQHHDRQRRDDADGLPASHMHS